MNKKLFKRLTFLATAAFMMAIGTLCLGVGLYWFNFFVPTLQSGEKTRAEMVLVQVTEKLEPVLEEADKIALEDLMVRLLLMKDPSSEENLILAIRVETLDGTRLIKKSDPPIEIAGPFAFTAPLYSSKTQEVLGEVSFQYNPHFYELLVEDARTKLFWLLGLIAGVIFLLQRVLLWLLKPLSQLNESLGKIDFSETTTLPGFKGLVVSEINEVVQSTQDLLSRLETSRESERRAKDEMERAQRVSSTGSWVWDIKSNRLTWSDEIYRIVGMSPKEVEPDYNLFLKLIHPDDRSMVEEGVARAVAGEEEYDIVHRLVRRDGTTRYIREKSQVTFDETGEAIQMIGTAQDITEQKLAEDLSLRFGRIMDESFNEIYIIDEETLKFTRINQSVENNIGYTKAEMAAMTPHDIAPNITEDEMNALFQSMRDEPEAMRIIQAVHRRKDGTDYQVEVRLQLFKHESPPQFVAIVQDITERKQVEDLALRLGRIMEESFNEIYIFDETSLRFIQVNQGACQNLGYTMEELSQITPVDIKPEYTLEQFEGLLQTLRDGSQELLVFKTIHQRKDGSTYPVEIRLQLSKQETPPQFVAIVQDISERIKGEQAMQQAMLTLEKRVQERTADLEKITRENELILTSAGEGICGIDKEGLIKFANPAARSILGYEGEDCAGKSHHDVCHYKRADGSPYPRHECPIEKSLQDGQAHKINDEVFWKKDGTPVPVEYVSTPIFEEGEVVGAVITFKDITERKLAEEKRLESEKRFRELFSANPDAILMVDAETEKIVDINATAEALYGYSREEFLKLTAKDVSAEPEESVESMKKVDSGEIDRIPLRYHRKKDGTVFPLEMKAGAFTVKEQRLIFGIVRDITERNKAEQEIVQAKEEAETYLDIAGSMIVSLNADGNVVLINKQGCEVLGYSREEILGKNWFQNFLPERDRDKVFQTFKMLMRGEIEGVERYTNPILNQSGQERLVDWQNSIIRNELGEVQAVLSSGRDITEQQKAQEKVRRSEEKFRKYFELPLAGIAITSPSAGWLEVNDRLCEFFGYSREELTGMTWTELTHPDDLEVDVTEFRKVLAGQIEGYTLEKRFINKEGEVVYAEISVRCVRNPDGEVDYFVALVQDINARKKAEQEMILAKEEAERASNAKSEFLSQMSHELRTPLNAILGFSQVMESDPEEPLTEFQQQSVTEIIKGGDHLLDLINEILDLSRIESGHLTLSLENVNLNLLTEELVTLCEPMAKKGNIELLNYVPLHDDLVVFADRVRLKQVLLNLMSNAIKYNQPGGSIKMDASVDKDDMISVSVADTGIGIPEDKLEELFQPFNRLGSEKTEIEGTGVGLTITKRLIEKMDGTIQVESQPGKGSTFTASFPKGQPVEEVEELPALASAVDFQQKPARDRRVVLYVEDNPANLNLVRHIFRRRPEILLLTAPDAKLGIELAEAHRPDVILLDINLPGMDGLTAFKHLKVMEATRTTPIIAISANAMARDIKNALEVGFTDYLTKPLDVTEFNRVIEETLQTSLRRK